VEEDTSASVTEPAAAFGCATTDFDVTAIATVDGVGRRSLAAGNEHTTAHCAGLRRASCQDADVSSISDVTVADCDDNFAAAPTRSGARENR
jgi:hypothetical protein